MKKIAGTALGVLAMGVGLFNGPVNVWAMGSPIGSPPESVESGEIEETFCYIPGAGGGSKWMMNVIPAQLRERDVPMITFDVGAGDLVQEHARRFAVLLEARAQANPNLRCHVVAYSMGGLIMRYAANHLYIDHPTMGKIRTSDLFLTMTSMASPHLGTPLPSIFKRYFGDLDRSRMQMDEKAIVIFNDPQYPEYSPIIPGKPSFSYRTFVTSGRETYTFPEKFGYDAIIRDSKQRRISEARNDGIVPLRSMAYGEVLADIKYPHSFFDEDIGAKPTLTDFFEVHWKQLHGEYDHLQQGEDPFWDFLNSILPEWIRKKPTLWD